MEENGAENENKASTSNATENENNETAKVVNEANYQSAQGAVSRAIDLYNEIKPSDNSNSTQLAEALNSLESGIENKSPFDQIDKIVDEEVSTLLNGIFKLNLAEEDHAEGEDHQEEDHAEDGEEIHSSSENETHETDSD
jgi:hypothetical protein